MTDEDPGLRIESFAVINLRGLSINKSITYKQKYYKQKYYISSLRSLLEEKTLVNLVTWLPDFGSHKYVPWEGWYFSMYVII
jgi:hypothetical protein